MPYLIFLPTAIVFLVLLAYAVQGVLATYIVHIEDRIAYNDRINSLAYPYEED